ncbi:MAG: NTP/NDP exchange transporter [Chlamydiales bacterium]|nr:NTP/NDP exchange transporter [Chlamydiales bacterium]NCF70283.1 NTP/NDP exchange transporter [Chlamydiales bacterium]
MSDNNSDNPGFGKLRSALWPIHGYELKKFLPMAFMMMFILFNYTIMRDTKDTLVRTSIGSEAFSFLKLFGTLPFAVLFMLFYSKLSNLLNKTALFHVTFGIFVGFFAIFGFVLYPYSAHFHPDPAWISALQAKTSIANIKIALACYGKWSYSLFYIMSELFGTAGISLLFWRFANDVVSRKKGETTRFYPLFGMVANVALMVSGKAIQEFSKVPKVMPDGSDPFIIAMKKMSIALIVCGLLTMVLYQWLQSILKDPRFAADTEAPKKKKKPQLSVWEGIKFVFSSKHLGLIAMLVICYGTALAITETVWKDQLGFVYPNKSEYSQFMGMYSFWTGVTTIIFMLIGSNVLRHLGWKFSALVTPIFLLLTGVPFFAFIVYKPQLADWSQNVFQMSPTHLAVWFGFALTIFVKAAKYSLFDPTKEMAYLPLGDDERAKGKAAVDVVGGRAGKSSGSAIIQGLLGVMGVAHVVEITHFLGVIIVATGLIWVVSSGGLGKSLDKLNAAEKS